MMIPKPDESRERRFCLWLGGFLDAFETEDNAPGSRILRIRTELSKVLATPVQVPGPTPRIPQRTRELPLSGERVPFDIRNERVEFTDE